METTSTMFIDVTQLVHWDGVLAGIPRVMNELAIRFSAQESNAVFVSWVKELQQFCEIDFPATMARQHGGIVYMQKGAEPGAAAVSASTATSVSGSAKRHLKRITKAGIARTGRIHPGIQRRLETRATSLYMRSYKVATFTKGDIMFISWGEWWDENFLAKLEDAHTHDGLRITTVIHDVGPMVTPHLSGHSTESLANYCRRIVPICAQVFCVSQNTKRDLTQWLQEQGLTPPHITVFRLGDDFKVATPKKPVNAVFAESKLKGNDYVLCVGTIELKKNHMLFYYVYKLAGLRGIRLPKLVIVGRKGWKTDAIIDLMQQDPVVKDKFVFLFNASDEELSWLYDHCLYSIFPSFYEGWGIPIAESVARGVPCLASNTTSMVEIAPGITEHFTPASPDECLAAMERWLDPSRLQQARQKTSEYKQVSWEDTFTQIYRHLKEL